MSGILLLVSARSIYRTSWRKNTRTPILNGNGNIAFPPVSAASIPDPVMSDDTIRRKLYLNGRYRNRANGGYQ
jgi:hypothetical protein